MNLQHIEAFAAHMKGNYSPAEKVARATRMVQAMKRPREGTDVPYQSKAQVRYMHAVHPKVAAEWDKKYGVPESLPEHAKKSGKAAAAKAALRSHKARRDK